MGFFFVARLDVEPAFALGFFSDFFGACSVSRVPAPADAGTDNVAGDDVETAGGGVKVTGAAELVLVATGALVVAAVTRPGAGHGPACVSAAAAVVAGLAVDGLDVPDVAGHRCSRERRSRRGAVLPLAEDQPLLLQAYVGQSVRVWVPFVGDPGAGPRGK